MKGKQQSPKSTQHANNQKERATAEAGLWKEPQEKARTIIEKRPDHPDFAWYVRELAEELMRRHFPLAYDEDAWRGRDPGNWLAPPPETPDNERIKKGLGESHFNISSLQKDWSDYCRKQRTIEEVSDAQHCFEELLIELPGRRFNKTPRNAQILSEAIKTILPLERDRYEGRRAKESHAKLQPGTFLDQTTAAEILGLKSTKQIRNLCISKKLIRNSAGKISADSLNKYRNTPRQPGRRAKT